LLCSLFNLDTRWGWWSTPRPGRFTPGKRPFTHCVLMVIARKSETDWTNLVKFSAYEVPVGRMLKKRNFLILDVVLCVRLVETKPVRGLL